MLKNGIKNLLTKLRDVFKEFPITLGCIILASLIGAVIIDLEYEGDWPERIIAFLMFMSVQTIGYEECLRKRKLPRILAIAASAVLAFIAMHLSFCTEEYLWGFEAERVMEICGRFYLVYFICVVAAGIFHMYKRSEKRFEKYVTTVVLEGFKATVIYGMFALGLLIILLIFDALIADTGYFILRSELFLAGGIYVPMLLRAFWGEKEEAGKFARVCVMYVLEPMVMIAFAIIYMYIIKIFVTDTVPQNTVFYILTFVLGAYAVIGNLANGISEASGLMEKIARILPYVAIPFVFLQIWSIGIRIADYGLTPARYMAVVLIIVELMYVAAYTYGHLKGKDIVGYMPIVVAAVAFVVLLVPGLCYDSVVIRSQFNRIERLGDINTLDDSQKATLASAYREIMLVGYRGEDALKDKYDDSQRELIESYDDCGQNIYKNYRYLYEYGEIEGMDISPYRTLYGASYSNYHDCRFKLNEKCYINIETKEESYQNVDISEILNRAVDSGGKMRSKNALVEMGAIRIDQETDMYLTSLNMRYDEESGEISELSISGYIFKK